VTNATGLDATYEIDLYWTIEDLRATPPEGASTAASNPGPTLLQALQDQLGLRLESKKGPVDVLVVDRALKTPTEN
jgi:uncharacterized protein (TIGR03435 family)